METLKTNEKYDLTIILLVGALVFLLTLITSLILQLSLVANLVIGWIVTTLYAIFSFVYIGTSIILIEKEVIKKPVRIEVPVDRIIEKEVIKEVPVYYQIPVENNTIEVVEKPIFQKVREPIYIEKAKKLEIPKFEYLGSTQTKTFHKRACKFSKLIKNKYKIHSNKQSFFKHRKFKPCKACLKK